MIIVDTGPLLAVLHADDKDHERCREFLESTSEQLLVPSTVVFEVCQLAEKLRGPEHEAAFLRSFVSGELDIESVGVEYFDRISELIVRYGDLPLGMVDASVVATAERMGCTEIATLDRRHFSIVRPKHCKAFQLLPN